MGSRGRYPGRPLRIMHLAHVINRYDFIDNVVRHVSPERFTGYAATFVPETNIHDPEFAAAGIPHFVLGARSRRDYPAAVVRLARLLRRHGIDVLHAHHFEPAAIGWAATRLHPSTRLVVGRHYSDDHHAYLTGSKRRAILGVESVVHGGARRIVSPSTMIRDLLVERQGVPEHKVVVIHYPFDPARYLLPSPTERARVRADLGVDGVFAIATVGRILPKKGHRFLLGAVQELAAELPDLVWVVLGDGPGRAELEAGVRAAGVADRVRFTGWRTDALAVMAGADAIVQSTLQEGFSQVMVEAQWMGTPLVMTDVSGARDLITSGQTGLIVPPANAGALAAAIRKLYRDPELRLELAAGGRARVESSLHLDAVIPRYEAVYDAALAG